MLEKVGVTENELLRRLTELLAQAAKPKYIILFGSQARGESSENSDFDVMVVEPQVADRGEEMVRLGRLLRPLNIAVDLLVVSAEKFEYWRDTPGNVYMKRREQALLLLRKAAQDEALLDRVLTCEEVSDEIIGFHCQQAAEKILKALLSDFGVRFRKTHEIGALMALLAEVSHPLPTQLEDLDALSPFGAIYRYEDYDAPVPLDRTAARRMLRELRLWVEVKLQERIAQIID